MKNLNQLKKKIITLQNELEECLTLLNKANPNQKTKNDGYSDIIQYIKDNYGKCGYFNDKRKSFRRLKIFYVQGIELKRLKTKLKNKFGDRIIEITYEPTSGIYDRYNGIKIKLPL